MPVWRKRDRSAPERGPQPLGEDRPGQPLGADRAGQPLGAAPRRRTFCVGLPKCGTHSLADMFAPVCRAAHEPEAEALLPLLPDARAGRIEVGELRSFFLARDERLQLDLESNHLLASFVPHLLDAFPEARFIVLVRELRSWVDSMINDQLNLREWDGYSRWKALYDAYLQPTSEAFPSGQDLLRELDLYPLDHYVRYWQEEVAQVRARVAAERLLCLRTEQLAGSVELLAEFIGVPAAGVALDRSHSYRARRDHGVLARLDSEAVRALA